MNGKRIRVALLSLENPYLGAMNGGKRVIQSRVQSLLQDDSPFDVDIYFLNQRCDGFAKEFRGYEKKARSIQEFSMNPAWKGFISQYPISVNKRYVKACVDALAEREYDVTIYEGEHMAKYRLLNAVHARKHIIYMYNLESEYRHEMAMAEDFLPLKWVNLIEGKRFKAIEAKIDGYFDKIWFISKDECKKFAARCGAEKCEYLPIPAVRIVSKAVTDVHSTYMLYVGDLCVEHNFLSVEWFARTVLPTIRASCPEAQLKIVGKISPKNKTKLKELDVEVCGYVDDLDKLYKQAAFVIAPVLYGAGVKVKIIDALARGQIIVTTGKGIEGTDLQNGKHLIVEDDPVKLAEYCCAVLADRDAYVHLAEDGLAFIKEVHTIEHQTQIINRTIDKLMKSSLPTDM